MFDWCDQIIFVLNFSIWCKYTQIFIICFVFIEEFLQTTILFAIAF